MAKARTLSSHIDITDLCNRNNDMRHAAIYEVNDLFFSANWKTTLSRKSVGSVIRRVTRSPFNSAEMTPAGVSKEIFALGSADLVCKAREAARAVAAHFRFSAIGVEIAHPEIGVVCWIFEQQNPSAPMPRWRSHN